MAKVLLDFFLLGTPELYALFLELQPDTVSGCDEGFSLLVGDQMRLPLMFLVGPPGLFVSARATLGR
jgi:hypothetical protein